VKLAWHIAKKDFRRLWPLLALWWGLLGLRALTPVLDLAAKLQNQPADSPLTQLNNIRPGAWLGADVLLLMIIAAAAVQTDSPIKSTSHWRMLPISGPRVFAAKILFLTLGCCVGGALINLGTKIAYGFPFANLLAGLGWFEWKITACLALGFMLASLFRRPFFALGIGLVVYICVVVFYDLPPIWFVRLDQLPWYDEHSLFLTRFLVWSNLLLAAPLAAAVFVYFRRKRVLGGLILLAGIGCAQWTQGSWPTYGFFPEPEEKDDLAPAVMIPDSSVPNFSIQISPLRFITYRRNGEDLYSVISGGTITGRQYPHPGDAWIISAAEWDLPLTGNGNFVLGAMPGPNFLQGSGPNLPLNYADILQAFGMKTLMQSPGDAFIHSLNLNTDKLAKLQNLISNNTLPKIKGSLFLSTGPLTRIGDAPLTLGAQFPHAQDSIAIQNIHVMDGGAPDADHYPTPSLEGLPLKTVGIDLIIQTLDPAGAPMQLLDPNWSWPGDPTKIHEVRDYYFVLWNPKRQESIPAQSLEIQPRWGYDDEYGQNEGNGLSIHTSARSIYFPFFHPEGQAPWTKEEVQQWLKDARLVELRFKPEHFYRVEADLDGLTIAGHIPLATPTPPTP